ncbi:MAG: helix-turn-helix domain-containing protein [Alphaproteobacteria bacterium]
MRKAIHPLDSLIALRMRRRRREIGMSQKILGEHLSVSFQQIQKYETAKSRIRASMLHEAASVLDVSIEYFFNNFSLHSKK